MSSENGNAQRRAREVIDGVLRAAGWIVQDNADVNRNASEGGAVREASLPNGPCDYLLFVGCKAAGVVEVKKADITLSGVVDRASKCMAKLADHLARWGDRLIFDYDSTGDEVLFRNTRKPHARSLWLLAFHRPQSPHAEVNQTGCAAACSRCQRRSVVDGRLESDGVHCRIPPMPSFAKGGTVALLLMVSLATAAAAVDCASEWRVVDRVLPLESGHLVSACRPSGSDYDAYRLEAVIDSPPALIAGAARAEMADPSSAPAKTEKTVLRDEGDELVVYTYARLPLVAHRDVVTRARQSFDPTNQSHRLEWRATDHFGPAPKKGVVRIDKSSGSWTFTPLETGKTRAVYESHSDLAGSVPAWLINSLMTDAVVDNLARLRARVERDRRNK